jgi:hypothetical protein
MSNFKYIDQVGVEFEGAWSAPPREVTATYHRDGSVQTDDVASFAGFKYIGEYVSEPLDSPEAVKNWMKYAYPSVNNSTCGLHVHVSFKDMRDYARIMEPQFQRFILLGLRAWGQAWNKRNYDTVAELPGVFWNRLGGEQHYCKRVYRQRRKRRAGRIGLQDCTPGPTPEKQVYYKEKSPHRYTVVNYCHGTHSTVELRVLPMFPAGHEQAVEAVMAYLALVTRYLDLFRKHRKGLPHASGLLAFVPVESKIEPEEVVLSDPETDELIEEAEVPGIHWELGLPPETLPESQVYGRAVSWDEGGVFPALQQQQRYVRNRVTGQMEHVGPMMQLIHDEMNIPLVTSNSANEEE